jgi:hypothetical protein
MDGLRNGGAREKGSHGHREENSAERLDRERKVSKGKSSHVRGPSSTIVRTVRRYTPEIADVHTTCRLFQGCRRLPCELSDLAQALRIERRVSDACDPAN